MSVLPLPPSWPIFVPMVIKLAKSIWQKIRGKDKNQEKIAEQRGFNPEKSTADEMAELQKMLNDYRTGIISEGNNLENEMMVEYSTEMQEIMDLFEEYNSTLKIMRAEAVKRRFRRLGNDIKGTFGEHITKRISLDDAECVSALKLPSGELKNQRLQELKEKVFLEAANEITRKIKENVDDFSETVEDAFYEHLDQNEVKLNEKTEAFEKLSHVAENDTVSVESALLSSDYMIALCSYGEVLM